MDKLNKKKIYALWALLGLIGLAAIIWILSMLLKPKIDYESMGKEIMQYTSELENIKNIKATSDSSFKITLESDSWYAGTDRDKMVFCKTVNEALTVICQKYKTIKDTQTAYVNYYDEDGIMIAEPKKGITLESTILH
ncbi:hypothetical protein [Lacrimispora sp.]|uniref:hypothetical protein n=1 Tax=Lacrimispora sp. TaxID=2719234 RepID=UPI002856D335|nr:hypothetical protein [Lacrimispora sp.]MDR7814524.1 hypothetical protein [Lacrimispora sp.]